MQKRRDGFSDLTEKELRQWWNAWHREKESSTYRSDVLKGSAPLGPPAHPRNTEDPSNEQSEKESTEAGRLQSVDHSVGYSVESIDYSVD